jgi:motility quorum-sensing regulator/GCU-specific mRNA interferase toxin
MVPRQEEKSSIPAYSLDRIHELVRSKKLVYGGRKVQRDIVSLRYELDDVCRCLLSLNACHFKESVHYADSGVCFDVYRVTCRGRDDEDDPLYIKLKLNRDCIVLVIGSFHR